jgi:hypothetical protein
MAWTVSGASADFTQNQGVVVFNRSGGIATAAESVNVTFQLVAPNQPPPQSATRQALIEQAKQILIDAANSAELKKAV